MKAALYIIFIVFFIATIYAAHSFPFEAILFVDPEDEIPVYDTFYIHKNLKP